MNTCGPPPTASPLCACGAGASCLPRRGRVPGGREGEGPAAVAPSEGPRVLASPGEVSRSDGGGGPPAARILWAAADWVPPVRLRRIRPPFGGTKGSRLPAPPGSAYLVGRRRLGPPCAPAAQGPLASPSAGGPPAARILWAAADWVPPVRLRRIRPPFEGTKGSRLPAPPGSAYLVDRRRLRPPCAPAAHPSPLRGDQGFSPPRTAGQRATCGPPPTASALCACGAMASCLPRRGRVPGGREGEGSRDLEPSWFKLSGKKRGLTMRRGRWVRGPGRDPGT